MSIFHSAAVAKRAVPHILWNQLQLLGFSTDDAQHPATHSRRGSSRNTIGPLMFRQSNELGLITVLHFLFCKIHPDNAVVWFVLPGRVYVGGGGGGGCLALTTAVFV